MGKKGAHFGASLVMQNCKPQDPVCQSVLAFGATLLCQNLDGKMNIINIYIYQYVFQIQGAKICSFLKIHWGDHG